MMKFCTIIFFLIIGLITHAQIVDIPDPAFKFILVTFPFADLNGDGNYDSNVDTNNDNEIQVSEAEAVFGLNLLPVETIYSIEGIEAFTNLNNLIITGHNISTFNVSQNLQLKVLHCGFNNIEQLILPNSTNLKELHCRFNEINYLDVTNFINLEILLCDFNEISSLGISNNVNLRQLGCAVNYINEIDVSLHPDLFYLSVADNFLTQLDVSQNFNLQYLDAGSNQLSLLDISNNEELISIHLYYTDVSELDFSQNLNLERASLAQNLFTDLDFSLNTNLKYLNCNNNMLESLNIQNGNNYNMSQMYAYANPNLQCIQVDDENFDEYPFCDLPYSYGWCIDGGVTLSEDCEKLGFGAPKEFTFSIYPNPVQNVLFIESQQNLETVKIYNLQGSLLKLVSENRIDVSQLSAGLYFVQVLIDEKRATKKFVKE